MEEIVIDAREGEKIAEFERVLKKFGVAYRIANCDCGDLNVGTRLVIERKTPLDFVQSLRDGRLLDQAVRMKDFEKQVLVVEGNLGELLYNQVRRGMNTNAILGAIASLIVDFQIPVVFAGRFSGLFYYHVLSRVLKNRSEGKVFVKKPKLVDFNACRLYMISALPGIGGSKALRILKTYKTVFNAIQNVDRWADDVEGVGEKIVESAKEVLYGEYNNQLQTKKT